MLSQFTHEKSKGIVLEAHLKRLQFNLMQAKKISEEIYNLSSPFKILNKPTHSEMVFIEKNLGPKDFQPTLPEFQDGITMGFFPHDSSWNGKAISDSFSRMNAIKEQTNQKIKFEHDCLEKIFPSTLDQTAFYYLFNLLGHRINLTSMNSFREGNCGELVSYALMRLLIEPQGLKENFNLEVLSLKSLYKNHTSNPITHIIGVVDRDPNSSVQDPSTWGPFSVVYDPWNRGAYFRAEEMMKRSYYRNGKWTLTVECTLKCPSINNLSPEAKDLFLFLENFILSEPLPEDKVVEYINTAFKAYAPKVSAISEAESCRPASLLPDRKREAPLKPG